MSNKVNVLQICGIYLVVKFAAKIAFSCLWVSWRGMKVPDFQIIPGMVDFRIISPDVNILSLRSQGFALLSIRILAKPQFYIISLLKWLL